MNGARVREGTEHIGSRGKRRIARPISSKRIEYATRVTRKNRWASEGRSVATHLKFMRAAIKSNKGALMRREGRRRTQGGRKVIQSTNRLSRPRWGHTWAKQGTGGSLVMLQRGAATIGGMVALITNNRREGRASRGKKVQRVVQLDIHRRVFA